MPVPSVAARRSSTLKTMNTTTSFVTTVDSSALYGNGEHDHGESRIGPSDPNPSDEE